MQNFGIQFTYPWLLLLIIPAIGVALIPYFLINKKYRRTRNRIVSIVLHSVIMVLAVSVLAGIKFVYQLPNTQNEVILLVDVSVTESENAEDRDKFVKNVISDGVGGNYKMGVVTFGFDQNYAVHLTNDLDSIYEDYKSADLPDIRATDITAALKYASSLFEFPETAKIVLISDGIETDEIGNSETIRSIVARGIKIDTVYIPTLENMELELLDIKMPDYHVDSGEECEIVVTVYNSDSVSRTATVTLYDNGKEGESLEAVCPSGASSYTVKHTFADKGLHEISFALSPASSSDSDENNGYRTYIDVQPFNDVLILEGFADQSIELTKFLEENAGYSVTVKTLGVSEDVPKTMDELRAYDQVILNNVSNSDLTAEINKGLDELLYSYVYDFGGGMFTVGGKGSGDTAHAYNEEDMRSSLWYSKMLPVQAVKYTPPMGVMILLDRSGSMADTASTPDGSTKLSYATSCISGLFTDGGETFSERDFFGLMTLTDDVDPVLPLTPRVYQDEIVSAINSVVEPNGGTRFRNAIRRAGAELRAESRIAKRHMIIVTDGEAFDAQDYEKIIEDNYNNDKITLSVILIGNSENSEAGQQMKRATDLGHGYLYAITSIQDLSRKLKDDLNTPEIKEVNYDEPFYPTVYDPFSPLVKGVEYKPEEKPEGSAPGEGTPGGSAPGEDAPEKFTNMLNVQLDGFFGVKVRSSDYLVLTGNYEVPIYAQWNFGKGKVGSFMCDLQRVWSDAFMSSVSGKAFLVNAFKNLMPMNDIRPSAIGFELDEENYINNLSVFTELGEGERVNGYIVKTEQGSETGDRISLNAVTDNGSLPLKDRTFFVTTALGEDNEFTRCSFIIRDTGTYKIVLEKCDAAGNVVDGCVTYKSFSYSKEFDVSLTASKNYKESLMLLAVRGNGACVADIEDPWEIYSNFVTAFDRSFDPRILFISIAITLFLLDVAVRKFKFKWIHEIIRDRKNKTDK